MDGTDWSGLAHAGTKPKAGKQDHRSGSRGSAFGADSRAGHAGALGGSGQSSAERLWRPGPGRTGNSRWRAGQRALRRLAWRRIELPLDPRHRRDRAPAPAHPPAAPLPKAAPPMREGEPPRARTLRDVPGAERPRSRPPSAAPPSGARASARLPTPRSCSASRVRTSSTWLLILALLIGTATVVKRLAGRPGAGEPG